MAPQRLIGTSSQVKLTRAKRRKLDKLAVKVDVISDDDRKFFERFPQRKFRIRLAGQAELDQQELINGRLQNCSSDNLLYVLVKNIKPSARMRVFVLGPDDLDTDLQDDTLRMCWDIVASEGVQTFEATARKIYGIDADQQQKL
jgi:hypothetical protein